ncbi:MAG: putative toxin-antitoxin system toxin component, PIN family [Chromatiaceae bacterium]|nr:putative toxin-antitoxin system toxin component, PIN family [Chromatiaceae bacterium]
MCPEFLQEYLEVIVRPKFRFSKDLLNRWQDILTQATVSIETPQIAIDFPRDRKDARFPSCAMAAAADFLLSGDADMDHARALIDTTILSPSQFLRLVECEPRATGGDARQARTSRTARPLGVWVS